MKILVCSDGSPAADNATRLGALIAAACNAEVTVLGIIESRGKTDAILDALRRNLQVFEERKIHAELVTITGQAVEEIIKQTEKSQYDMVVIGAVFKRARGLFWRSSKSYRIIKTIHPPVLVVMERISSIKQILICTGGRRDIENAVALAGRIAAGVQASITLFHVMPEPPALYARLHRLEVSVPAILKSNSELGKNLREQKKTLETLGVTVDVKLRQGAVLEQIFREIRAGNYELVVTGSSANRRDFRTYVLGDVTREIVNRSKCAVLVVRSGPTVGGILRNMFGRLGRKRKSIDAKKQS